MIYPASVYRWGIKWRIMTIVFSGPECRDSSRYFMIYYHSSNWPKILSPQKCLRPKLLPITNRLKRGISSKQTVRTCFDTEMAGIFQSIERLCYNGALAPEKRKSGKFPCVSKLSFNRCAKAMENLVTPRLHLITPMPYHKVQINVDFSRITNDGEF